jgi:hypothetical protein
MNRPDPLTREAKSVRRFSDKNSADPPQSTHGGSADEHHLLCRYRIKPVRTAKYKTKPKAITIDTNQIATLPSRGTFP